MSGENGPRTGKAAGGNHPSTWCGVYPGVALLLLSLLGACIGEMQSPGKRPEAPDAPETPKDKTPTDDYGGSQASVLPTAAECAEDPGLVADLPVRLLTAVEINNSLAQVFPSMQFDPTPMPADSRVGSFVLNGRENTSATHVRDFRALAEGYARKLATKVGTVAPCAAGLAGAALLECAKEHIGRLSVSLLRRPASAEALSGLQRLYEAGLATGNHASGMHYVFEALLQAPGFIYQHVTAPAPGTTRDLDGFEIGQRMAAMLWRSVPDETLMQAATAGQLAQAEDRIRHARRMLSTPLGQRTMRNLALQWTGVDRLPEQSFAQEAGNQELLQSMVQESRLFAEHVVQETGANWRELMSAPYTFVNATLAAHYAISTDGAEQVRPGVWKVPTPDRAGMLMQSSFLALESRPVFRGFSIRRTFLCGDVPGPGEIDPKSVPTFEKESERSKSVTRLETAACGSCHANMDPLGLAFDTFDELGRQRRFDKHGNAVDSRSTIRSTRSLDGPVADGVELVQRMADSEEVRECFARNLFIWAFARPSTEADNCTIARISEQLKTGDDDWRAALIAIVGDRRFTQTSTSTQASGAGSEN